MKTKIKNLILALALFAGTCASFGQGTAFTYQGRLNSGGAPASGLYDYRFKLYADPLGNTQVGSSYLTNAIGVTNGLFSTTIDFGAGIFTGGTNWLEMEVRTNGAVSYTVLTPLQGVTPTPNAIFAETAGNVSGTVSAAQLSGVVASTNLPSSPTVSGTVTAGAFTGNGANVTNVNAAALNGLSAASFWQLGGNNVAGGQFIGSTNNQPLELRVGGVRVGLISLAYGSPNITLGGSQNVISNGTSASSILGGSNNTIQVSSDYSTIAGGTANYAAGVGSFIGGGGFDGSNVGGNTNYGIAAVIVGGVKNLIASGGSESVIGGGYNNMIQASALGSIIVGGFNNMIEGNSFTSVIGGGDGNMIQINAGNSMIGGGSHNTIETYAFDSMIGGGIDNLVQTYAYNSMIGGGIANTIQTNAAYSTIGGGYLNDVSGIGGFIGGGGTDGTSIVGNTNYGNAAAIVGGMDNLILGGATESVIGGGLQNTIQGNAYQSTLGGGDNNVITTGAYVATLGGGANNVVGGAGGTVPGGNGNGAIGINSFAAGTDAQATYNGSFVLADLNYVNFYSTAANQFSARFGGGYRFVTGGGVVFTTGSGANQTVTWSPGSGSWSFTSDRNTKDRFAAVDAQSVLQKVAQLPVSEWSYKGYDQRHIGAMAQDFHELFPLNGDDKVLNDADLHGVELAAIKGLNQKLEAGSQNSEVRIQKIELENAELKQNLAQLKQLVQSLAEKK